MILEVWRSNHTYSYKENFGNVNLIYHAQAKAFVWLAKIKIERGNPTYGLKYFLFQLKDWTGVGILVTKLQPGGYKNIPTSYKPSYFCHVWQFEGLLKSVVKTLFCDDKGVL